MFCTIFNNKHRNSISRYLVKIHDIFFIIIQKIIVKKENIVITAVITMCFICSYQVNAQSKNWLTYDMGTGISTANGQLSTYLSTVVIGYKRVIWNDRLILHPSLEIESSWKGIKTNLREEITNSLHLNLTVDYDIICYKTIIFNIETGGFAVYSRKLMGTNNMYDYPMSAGIMFKTSEYKDLYNCGALFAAGIRIVPWNKSCAFRITPFSLCVTHNRAELRALLGLDVRLNEKKTITKK